MILIKDIERFIEEDMYYGDATDLFIPSKTVKAKIFSKSKTSFVVSGTEVAIAIFKYFDIKFKKNVSDGDKIDYGTIIFHIEGESRNILKAERLTLNFLSHLCGVATNTNEYAEIINEACKIEIKKIGKYIKIPKIAGTRKTTPGLRKFEKRAIYHGGGDPHRNNLSECVMIKDNHIEILGLVKSVKLAKENSSFTQKVEIEVENKKDAVLVAEAGADIIMLDNMNPEQIEETIDLLIENKLRDKVILEVSGNVTKENISEYAITGVDIISSSKVVTEAPWVDISLDIIKSKHQKDSFE